MFANVGDTRIYVIRRDVVDGVQAAILSRDHTLFAEYIEMGHSSADVPSEAKHVLTQGLGLTSIVIPHTGIMEVQSSDRVIICTDGAYGSIPTETLIDAIGEQTPENSSKAIVMASLAVGGDDNTTALVIQI